VKSFSGSSFECFRKFVLPLLMLCCAWPGVDTLAETASKDPVVADIQVEVDDSYGNRNDWVDMVQSLAALHVRRGHRLQPSDIERLAAALADCRRFRSIHLDTQTRQADLVLVIRVTPFRLIQDIRIHGKYPLFEKQILNSMTLYPGDAYIQEEVDKQPRLVAGLYRRHGYVDPKVTIQSVRDPDDIHYTLELKIEKGHRYRLGRLEISGNTAFPDTKIRRVMRSIRRNSQKFSEKKFTADLEKLKAFYVKQRFPDVKIAHRLARNPDIGTVDIQIKLEEGARYDVTFEGNKAFKKSKLTKDLVLFQSGNRHGAGWRKSIRNIRKRYREAGYADVDITVKTERVTENDIAVKRLQVIITESARSIVSDIIFSGNTVFSDEELKEQMTTRLPGWLNDGAYVQEFIEQDVLVIKSRYHEKGYLNPEVERSIQFEPDTSNLQVVLHIREGLQTNVIDVQVEGLTSIPLTEITEVMQLQKGRAFSHGKLESDKKRIAAWVAEKGFPYVRVSGDATFNEDMSQARVVFQVHQEQAAVMGKTFYTGNFRTKKKILDREQTLKPGDPFSLKQMIQGQQNIRSLDIFRSVTFNTMGLKEELQTLHLFVEVEEEKSYYFETAGGYASEKGLYANSKIGDHNFLGLNKDFKAGAEISETGHRAETRLVEPRFLGTRISADVGAFIERKEPYNQDFGSDSTGGDLLFSRKWSKQISTGLSLKYERREQYARNDDTDEDDTYDPRGILVASPSVSYDSRDNFMNPKQGVFWMAGIGFSRGLENSLDDFYKFRTDLRGYVTPLERLTLAGRGSLGLIKPYGSKGNIPDDQLFFLGGTTSVRGFDENLLLYDADDDPVGGRQMGIGNAEARIHLGANVDFSVFCDIGYLDETDTRDTPKNVRYSTGIGLRYVTLVGAVGLTYGHKLNPEAGESPGRLHFSIGYTF